MKLVHAVLLASFALQNLAPRDGLHGVSLGDTIDQVKKQHGEPEWDPGHMDASWSTGLRVSSRDGVVWQISTKQPNKQNRPVDIGASLRSVVEVLGDANHERAWAKGYTAHVWYGRKLLVITADATRTVVRLEFTDYDLFERTVLEAYERSEQERKTRPDYGLVLRKSSSLYKESGLFTSATVLGVVKNYRDTAVVITVTVECTSKKGGYAGGASETLRGVEPNEERQFSITSYEVFRPHGYSVKFRAGR